MSKNNKHKVITGTDIAFWLSIVMMISSLIGVVLEFVYKTYDFKYWSLFFLFGVISCLNNQKDRKNKDNAR